MLINVAPYLHWTRLWGLIFRRPTPTPSLSHSSIQLVSGPSGLPDFPIPDKPGQLIGFVNTAHANNLRHCHSTTGYAFLLNFGVISYRSKTQSNSAASSTEAEFLAAVTAAKHAKYLRAVLLELGYPRDVPTPLYEDNMSAINMINNHVPTERSCHIDIQHFAIQDWAEAKDIVMCHILGILSIPDGLTKVLSWVLRLALPPCWLYDGPFPQFSCRGSYFACLTDSQKIFSHPLHPCFCLFYG